MQFGFWVGFASNILNAKKVFAKFQILHIHFALFSAPSEDPDPILSLCQEERAKLRRALGQPVLLKPSPKSGARTRSKSANKQRTSQGETPKERELRKKVRGDSSEGETPDWWNTEWFQKWGYAGVGGGGDGGYAGGWDSWSSSGWGKDQQWGGQ